MCISPSLLSDGTTVGCRKCWQCLEHKVDDWVGRCIAESKLSVAAMSITLTYGRDEDGNESHARSAILTYSDVQKYVKQLRKRGLKVRYFAVGEMGSKKGRSHWHVLAFFQNALPDGFWDYGANSWHRAKRVQRVWVPLVWHKRFNEPCWPHGFSHWEPIVKGHAKGSVRYACKYINKDFGDNAAQSKLAMSKLPPLGARYFEQRAQKFVDEGISPPDGFYTFPDEARRKNGDIIRFRLDGKSADLFCQHFIDKWRSQRGGHWPHSDYIEEYEDRITRAEWDREAQALEERIRPARRWPFNPPLGYADIDIRVGNHPDDPFGAGSPMVITPDGPLWYGSDKEGKRAWRSVPPVAIKPTVQQVPIAQRRLTQLQWVEHLAPRWVFWISMSVAGRGRYKLAKTLHDNGKPVWLRSMSS